jgi:trigger factor
MLELEVEDERVQRALDSTYRRLAKRVKVPGFRPGKAPRAVLERHLGEDTIRHEAIDELMPQLYREALEQEQIDAIDRAEYELVTEQPLVAKFTIPIRPTVDLGDYASLRVSREPVVVDPERVQEALEALRHRYATLEPVTRPTQWGDVIHADVHGTIEGTAFVQEEDAQFQLQEGRAISFPGFTEALLGREKGPPFEFEVTVPEDLPDERLRGKQARYTVEIKEVKQEVLPELDDEFGRQVGEGFASLEELRSRVEADLREALEREAEHQYEEQALDTLAGRAQVEYPAVLVEREIDRLLQEQAGIGRSPERGRNSGPSSREELDRYLQRAGKTEEEMRAELRPAADTRVRRSLVLSEVSEAEHIEVTDAEVEEELNRLTASVSGPEDEVRRLFSSESAKESMRRSLMTRKTLARLVEIASGGESTVDAEAGADPE